MSEPLQRITDVVSALVLHSGEEEFVRTADEQMAGVGAAGGGLLAVVGLAGVAAVVIWYFTDDALQNWCNQSAFGKKPQTKRYATAEVQTEALQQAMVEVL